MHRGCLLFALMLFGTNIARAEPGGVARSEADRTRARDLMREGNELYSEGKPAEAYAKYLDAWRTAQAFDIACNLGGTASELGMNRDAAEYLDYCLRHYAASSRPEAMAAEQRARAAFEVVRSKVSAVNVMVTPPGADVLVDGAPAGRAPLSAPVFLEAGPHRIEARLEGHETATLDVNAKRGESTEVTLALKTPSGAPAGEHPPLDSQTGQKDEAPSSENYVPAIVTASFGGVALASGVVFLVMRSGRQSDASDELETLDGTNPCGPHSPRENVPTCGEIEKLSDQAATFGTLSIVSFGVAAGAGIATYFLWPRGERRSGVRGVHPSVAISHDGLYASLSGSF